ncbi:aspartyl-phosphate phosphatase Spo0E family protein [Peribacillus sp. SCS-155]|uniref:aspartyl-phosphate phosphatase Spo0E family protein n=1 Tax=Peribacillus sedimenti TaxID=3115297 RepID=UPI003905E15C
MSSIKNYTPTKEEIIKMIDELRHELIQTGMKEGLASSATINISQKLDKFIYMYQKMHRLI